jgi:hypothetical protein
MMEIPETGLKIAAVADDQVLVVVGMIEIP